MELFQQLFNHYNEFYVEAIATNRFSASDFHRQFKLEVGEFAIERRGESVAGKPINSVTIGEGPVKVLLWSQMHGNESTATRAILDILRFFAIESSFSDFKNMLRRELTICILPMLNPDGTDKFQRRNALDIDLNRDARSFESPESKILRAVISTFKPEYAFNLHDQRRFYNIPGTGKPSTIAFLAPAYNNLEEINDSRKRAMQLIVQLRNALETVIPGQVGIYDDTYSSRAFGDYTQGTGASTILVESGWSADDMEKEYVRKLNFCLLISGFYAISKGSFSDFSIADYRQIPMNDEKLFDVLIRQASVEAKSSSYKLDVGIMRTEMSIPASTKYYSIGQVADIGDLQDWYGFDEIDATGLMLTPGLIFTGKMPPTRTAAAELLKKGYLYVQSADHHLNEFIDLPINIITPNYVPDKRPVFEGKANFLLKTAAGDIKYILINGFIWDIDKSLPKDVNGSLPG